MDLPYIDPFSAEVDFSPASVWVHAKREYLQGIPARTICERYEIPLSTFRTRARSEGWRLCDREAELIEARTLEPAPPTADLVEQAWRAMADALKRGRAYEARTFMRLTQDLREEVRREEAVARLAKTREPTAEEAGDALEKSDDTATPDPELHTLHQDGGGATDDDAALDALSVECDRLRARARAGKASRSELLELRTLHDALQQGRKVRELLSGQDSRPPGGD
jgi:hypothetical protein